MTTENSPRCIANTLVYEGAFGRTRADRGDWTSGKIGVGRLAGTAYGIAAMTLKERGLSEDTDLSKMTKDQAIALYRAKEWKEVAGDQMPKGIDQIVYDGTVNSGKGRGVPWVGRAVGCKFPTNALAIASTASALSHEKRRAAVKAACAARMAFLRGLAIFSTFGKGWTTRVAGMEAIGVKMVLEDSLIAPADIKRELEGEAKVANKQGTNSAAGSATTGTVSGGAATQAPDPTTLDWSHIIGGSIVTVLVIGVVIVLGVMAYQHFQRKSAYLAAANGDIGG